MSILHLFFAIIALLVISVVFVVVNLVYHVKITSRLSNLEKDVEKKTLEFDALKKDRSAGPSAASHDAQLDTHTRVFEMPLLQDVQQPVEDTPVDGGSIQIVRNVRGTFETTDTMIHDHAYPETPAEPEPIPPQPKTATPPFSHGSPFASIAAVKKPAPPPARVVIPLFSKTAQGPDFNQLYQSLVEAMKTSVDSAFAFDLSGIDSLSEGELEYLEKIYSSLASQRRSLAFLHCSGNLAALIRQRPHIASLIR